MVNTAVLNKAVESGMPYHALMEVYERGEGAWGSNLSSVRLRKDFSKNPNTAKYPRSARLGREQWAMARVRAFIEKRPTVYYGADDYIRRKYRLK
jgi:hypothetical protein